MRPRLCNPKTAHLGLDVAPWDSPNSRGSLAAGSLKMALPLPPSLTPSEVAFLCEMELVTIIPRQRLEGLELLGVSRPQMQPG
jgi:hypothetical protein